LVEALCCKPEGCRFNSWMRWIFFNLPNPSSCTIALGLTQPLTEWRTRNLRDANCQVYCWTTKNQRLDLVQRSIPSKKVKETAGRAGAGNAETLAPKR
jgi:hypothetical protein